MTSIDTATPAFLARRPDNAGGSLCVRDRAAGTLLRLDVGPAGIGTPDLVGEGFTPSIAPMITAGDFDGNGTTQVLCGLPVAGGARTVQIRAVAGALGPRAAVLSVDQAGDVRISFVDVGAEFVQWSTGVLTTLAPDTVVLGMADVTGTGRPDLVVRRADGGVGVLEFPERPGSGVWFDLGTSFDGALVVTALDRGSDDPADLLALDPCGDLLLFPHAGVFWPQDPAASFSAPIRIGGGFGDYEFVG
ncbi:hypothetical protein [Cryptosporangium japonicum]|uniref:FG-GAP repeat protein n=1 Tax=Cryptosporangium japonicum TaxID=80872 RepID=A0ABP3D9H4_9ACTN